jgi:hypothetical protein
MMCLSLFVQSNVMMQLDGESIMVRKMRKQLMVDVELLYLQALKVRLDFVNGIVLLDLQNVIKTLR